MQPVPTSSQIPIPECFDSMEDALKAVVMALGGFKKVGVAMRGADFNGDAEKAADWLRKCLQGDRREQLHLAHVQWLLREAKRAGFHAAMDYFAGTVEYKAQPVDAEQQVRDLQERIAAGVEGLNKAMQQLASLQARAS